MVGITMTHGERADIERRLAYHAGRLPVPTPDLLFAEAGFTNSAAVVALVLDLMDKLAAAYAEPPLFTASQIQPRDLVLAMVAEGWEVVGRGPGHIRLDPGSLLVLTSVDAAGDALQQDATLRYLHQTVLLGRRAAAVLAALPVPAAVAESATK